MSGPIRVGPLAFDAVTAGEPGNPLVLLLHGFPQTSHTWRHQMAPLAAAGYFAVAPDQRGYSAGARPVGAAAYASELLVQDALNLAASLGYEAFDLVGHDWGGQLSWLLAALHPEALRTLTVLSRPHPAAFARAWREDPGQSERSKHHRAFQDEAMADRLLENDAAGLWRFFAGQGVAPVDVQAYLAVLSSRDALDAALNWYRSAGGGGLAAADVPAVSVPVLYVWGDADSTVGRVAAEATADCVTGPYRFEVLPGVGHFVTDQAGETVTRLLLSHLADACSPA